MFIIKEYRIKRGYSQEQLAELMDLSPRQIQRIENGYSDTSLKTLRLFVKILNISDKDIVIMIRNDDKI